MYYIRRELKLQVLRDCTTKVHQNDSIWNSILRNFLLDRKKTETAARWLIRESIQRIEFDFELFLEEDIKDMVDSFLLFTRCYVYTKEIEDGDIENDENN